MNKNFINKTNKTNKTYEHKYIKYKTKYSQLQRDNMKGGGKSTWGEFLKLVTNH